MHYAIISVMLCIMRSNFGLFTLCSPLCPGVRCSLHRASIASSKPLQVSPADACTYINKALSYIVSLKYGGYVIVHQQPATLLNEMHSSHRSIHQILDRSYAARSQTHHLILLLLPCSGRQFTSSCSDGISCDAPANGRLSWTYEDRRRFASIHAVPCRHAKGLQPTVVGPCAQLAG